MNNSKPYYRSLTNQECVDMYSDIFSFVGSSIDLINDTFKSIGLVIKLSFPIPETTLAISSSSSNTSLYSADQRIAIKYVITDTLVGLCTVITHVFGAPGCKYKFGNVDISSTVLKDTKKIIQDGIGAILPNFRETGLIFQPVNMSNDKIESYSVNQELALKAATMDLFTSMLSIVQIILQGATAAFIGDTEVPNSKNLKYLN
jgi:hypothetical protein